MAAAHYGGGLCPLVSPGRRVPFRSWPGATSEANETSPIGY
jgi:hypothetical protein